MPAFEPIQQTRSHWARSNQRSASCPTERELEAAAPTTPPPSPVNGAFPCILSSDMRTSRTATGRTSPPPEYELIGRRRLCKLPSPYWYPLAYNRNGEIIDPSIDPEAWSISSTTVQTASCPEDESSFTKKSIARCVMRFTGVYFFLALFICTPLFFFYQWCWKVCSGPSASDFYREYALRHDYPTTGARPGFYWSISAIIYSSLGPVMNHFAFRMLEKWVAGYINDASEGAFGYENSSIHRYSNGKEKCWKIQWGTIRRVLRKVYLLQQGILYLSAVAALLIASVVAILTLVTCPASLV